MKQFLSYFSLLIIILIISCTPFLKTATWPESRQSPREQPVTIIVDADFTVPQQILIAQAMLAWEGASSHKVKFKPAWNIPKPGPFKNFYPLMFDQGIFMWSLPKDPHHLSDSQLEQAKPLGGLTIYGPGENSAHVIIYADLPAKHFYGVALHELGHLIGLNHIDGKTVMHKNIKSHCITALDAKQLCELYGCVPKPDC